MPSAYNVNVHRKGKRMPWKAAGKAIPKRFQEKVPRYIRDYVSNSIFRSEETKLTRNVNDQRPIFPTIGTNLSTESVPVPLLPQIGNSGGQAGRIGNKIMITKLRVRGVVHSNPQMISPNLVKVIIFSRKFIQNENDPIGAATYNRFLQDGNSAINYTDTIDDFMLPFNRNVITVHDVRTFKVGPAVTGAPVANNDYSLDPLFSMDALKGTNHRVEVNYDDQENNNKPYGFERWIVAVSVRPDGTPHTGGVNEANYSWAVECEYKEL